MKIIKISTCLKTAALLAGVATLCACASSHYKDSLKHKDRATGTYTADGKRYTVLTPRQAAGYKETGIAVVRNHGVFAAHTASGEKQRRWTRAAAHRTLPLPCIVRMTNLENGKVMRVRVNDRGPYNSNAMISVTPRVANALGFYEKGQARVKIEVIDASPRR